MIKQFVLLQKINNENIYATHQAEFTNNVG
jgi:hypothetical protein